MTACASSTNPPRIINPPPADLAAYCPALPELQGKTGADVLPYILELHNMYKDCAFKHAWLVDAWPK